MSYHRVRSATTPSPHDDDRRTTLARAMGQVTTTAMMAHQKIDGREGSGSSSHGSGGGGSALLNDDARRTNANGAHGHHHHAVVNGKSHHVNGGGGALKGPPPPPISPTRRSATVVELESMRRHRASSEHIGGGADHHHHHHASAAIHNTMTGSSSASSSGGAGDAGMVESGGGHGLSIVSKTLDDAREQALGLLGGGTAGGASDKSPPLVATKELASASASCVAYMACSTVMVLANKWLASSLDVRAHVSLLLMQNGVATALVAACRGVGVVSYAGIEPRIAAKWLPVNGFFVAMLLTSFVAMRYLSVPMITVFKQLANLLTVTGEYYFFGKPISACVAVSFATMILGAALAAYNDLAFSPVGYAWQAANCCATSAYVLYLRHATRTIQLNKYGMVFYNNLLSLPLLAVIAVAHGEPAALLDAHRRGALDATFFAYNAVAGSLGMLLNLASVWCVAATSATTYAITGALNKIPTTILGYLLFDTVISHQMAIYIALSLAGGFMYSAEKLRQMRRDPGN